MGMVSLEFARILLTRSLVKNPVHVDPLASPYFILP
jgi:hypothetical protein